MLISPPFGYSDPLIGRIIARSQAKEPGRFSPEFKWRRTVLASVHRSMTPLRILATGSFAHGTAVKGLSDRDYFVVLQGSPPASPMSVLRTLYSTLRNELSSATHLALDPPVVSIRDPYDGLVIDLAPAFRFADSDYLIPGPDGRTWIRSNPVAHITYLMRADVASEGDSRDAVIMMKQWKYVNIPAMSSLYLEMATAKYCLESPQRHWLQYLIGILDVLFKSRLAAIDDPSVTVRRPLTAYGIEPWDDRETVRAVTRSRDLALRMDAAEKSHALNEVENCGRMLFGVRGDFQPLERLSIGLRRDPNRMQFRGARPPEL